MGKEGLSPSAFAYEKMYHALSQHGDITPTMWESICAISSFRRFPKGELLQEEGRGCRHIYFIVKGICSCFLQQEDRESVLAFAKEGEFCTSCHSLFSKNSSFLNIKTLEPTEVICIPATGHETLCREYPEIACLFYKLLELHVCKLEEMIYRMRCFDAMERVTHFMQTDNQKELIKRIPQYYIASYLNMAPETFSKILKSFLSMRSE